MIKDIKSYLISKPWNVLFFEFSTYLFVGTLPLLLKINTITLWFFILGSIFTFKNRKPLLNLKQNKTVLLVLFMLFGLYVISFFLSKETSRVLNDIGRTAPILLIPLFVFSHTKKDFNIKNIYVSLGVGLFVGMLICWYHILASILSRENYIEQATYFFQWVYTDVNLVKPLEGHPSYFAILIVLFLTAIIESKHFEIFRKNKLKFILLLIPFLLFLIETSSRVGVISLVIIVSIYSYRKFKIKAIPLIIGSLFVIVFLSLKFDYLGAKFKKTLNAQGEIKIERFHRWKEILKVIDEKEKWIFGVGSGDSRLVYRRAYYNGNFDLALKNNYNAHNQYLEFLISNGVIGLVIYCFALFLFIYYTKYKTEALCFSIVIVLFSMSESFFGRSQGVFIFSFFYSFLIMYYKPVNEKNTN